MSLLKSGLGLFLGLVWWMSIANAITPNAAGYTCKHPKVPLNFSICENYKLFDHIHQIGCDLYCMMFFDETQAKDGIIIMDTPSSFNNLCLMAKPAALLQATDDPKDRQLGYAEFVVLLGAVTPACLRESLVVFDDIVTVNPRKITELDTMTFKDLDSWLISIQEYGDPNYDPLAATEIYKVTTMAQFKYYWDKKIKARINQEKIECKRDDIPPG